MHLRRIPCVLVTVRRYAAVGSGISAHLAENVAPPPTLGPHKIACGDFAGSPIRDKVLSSDMGVLFPPPPLRDSSPTREECSPLSWKYCYPLPAGFPLIYPTENTFGGDPDRSPLKGNPPFRGTPDAIDAERSNRYTFGAARRDWRGAQQSLDLRSGTLRSHTGSPREKSLIFRVGQEARHSRGLRPVKRASPCERLVSGSTSNEITSCHTTSRSGCS